MSPAARKFHRLAGPWLALPLLLTLATGVAYRVGRAWFGLSKDTGNKLLAVHAGDWLGPGSPFYVLLIGGGLLALLATGGALLWKSRAKTGARAWHRWLGLVFLLPLATSAVTGIAFKLGDAWFHFPENVQDLLMNLHEGAWLGPKLKPVYVLLVGAGLLALAFSGLRLAGGFKKSRA